MTHEMFTLSINLGNAAFDDSPMTELARILRDLAHKVETGQAIFDSGKVWDANGNTVGHYKFGGRS